MRFEIGGRTIWRVLGAIVATVFLLAVAVAMRGLLSMVALAFFFSLALDPAVRWLRSRFGWRRGVAVGVIYAAGVVFLAFMVLFLIPALGELGTRVQEDGDEWIAGFNEWAQDSLGVELGADVPSGVVGAGREVDQFAERAFGTLTGIASGGISLVFHMATIGLFTFYLTAQAPGVQRAVLRLFAPAAQRRIGWVWDQAIEQTGGYFYSRLILMAINGAGFVVTLIVVGVPVSLAVPMGVFAGFVSVFIPAVGTYIGAAIPALITLALEGLAAAVIVVGYAVVYQQIENFVLSPRISANTMSLNGGVAFGAALAGGSLAGPVGAFVALPVAALISATVSNYVRSHEVVYNFGDADADDEPMR